MAALSLVEVSPAGSTVPVAVTFPATPPLKVVVPVTVKLSATVTSEVVWPSVIAIPDVSVASFKAPTAFVIYECEPSWFQGHKMQPHAVAVGPCGKANLVETENPAGTLQLILRPAGFPPPPRECAALQHTVQGMGPPFNCALLCAFPDSVAPLGR